MIKVYFTQTFRRHLREIRDYIAQESTFQSRRVVTEILRTVRRLLDFPEIGAFIPEMKAKRYREIHVFNYRIIYRFLKKTNEIQVVAVVHAARQLSHKFFREIE